MGCLSGARPLGTHRAGIFEERLTGVLREAQRPGADIILFIDELHTIVGAGQAEGALDAANILKPALARGTLRCIGATTSSEWDRSIGPDPALARRLQPVMVNEPSAEAALVMVRGAAARYGAYHDVTFAAGTLEAAVACAVRCGGSRRLPDSAIDLVDEAAAAAHVQAAAASQTPPPQLRHSDAAVGWAATTAGAPRLGPIIRSLPTCH